MKVKITTPYIELQQLLKITSWIDSCGEAKIAVKKLNIKVDGTKLKELIRKNDSKALMYITTVNEAIGTGFKDIN